MSTIEFNRVTFGYQNEPIISDLSLRVEPNSFWAIVGPNGSGKSTLLNLLCGVLRPRQGTIHIDSKPVVEYTARQQAFLMSLVRQEFVPAFEYTVSEIVMMARYIRCKRTLFEDTEDRRVVTSAMKATGILEFAARPLGHLSGGERQRVFIARALAQETPILLLDEPTSHLDLKHQVRIFDLLKQMQCEQGKTILLVTHDLNLAAQYCDHVLLLGEGGGYFHGPPGKVLNAAQIQDIFGVRGYQGQIGEEGFFMPLGRFSKYVTENDS